MTVIKRNEKRLKPGDCCSFFSNNRDLYQDLKDGKEITIPDLAKDEVMEHFVGLIEVVRKRKVKKEKDKEIEK